ncbi:MAG TPA: YkvA family protein [Anaerolineaceae bacterium]
MDKNRKSNQTITSRASFFRDLTDRFRLISRLMMDRRVNPLLKLLPVGALVYAIWPFDLPGPIDDVFVIWLGTTLFVQFCPQEVVDEHMRALQGRANPAGWADVSGPEVIDGEYYETDPRNDHQNYGR